MWSAVAALFLAFVASFTWTTFAQDAPPIWSGVYTAAQAERGHAVMQQHCGECHGEDFGGGEAPALTGSTFMIKWETHTVERLFQKIRDTMPSRGSTAVSEKEKLDAVAYILQQNGFPAGNTELTDTRRASRRSGSFRKKGPRRPAPARSCRRWAACSKAARTAGC